MVTLVLPHLPDALAPPQDLALDLRWTWSHGALVQRMDLRLAGVPGAGVDVPDRDTATKAPTCGAGELRSGDRQLICWRRRLGQRSDEHAFNQESVYLANRLAKATTCWAR